MVKGVCLSGWGMPGMGKAVMQMGIVAPGMSAGMYLSCEGSRASHLTSDLGDSEFLPFMLSEYLLSPQKRFSILREIRYAHK